MTLVLAGEDGLDCIYLWSDLYLINSLKKGINNVKMEKIARKETLSQLEMNDKLTIFKIKIR